MQAAIKILKEKKLVGKHLTMSFARNRTAELWRSFMPERKQVKNIAENELFSLQVYPPGFSFDPLHFDAAKSFEKWAAVEVNDFKQAPEGMETFLLPEGMYAVFLHRGPASEGERSFRYIFGTWLPASEYILDDRPHFEILGEKYQHESPDSEEEIWIPVKLK